jgi:hypothetical protein
MRLHDRIVRGIRPALLILLGAVTGAARRLRQRGQSAAGPREQPRARGGRARGRRRRTRVSSSEFLVESVVLGVAGGVAGLAVRILGHRALVALGPSRIPRLAGSRRRLAVLMFVVAVAVATSVVFGLVPALTTTGLVRASSSTAGRGLIVGRRERASAGRWSSPKWRWP